MRRPPHFDWFWRSFLRTPSGRQLLRQNVFRRWWRRPLDGRITVRSKLWLALIIVLVLLALLVGGWIGLLSGKQRWLDDYAAFQNPFEASGSTHARST
jgi:hypothetical protein